MGETLTSLVAGKVRPLGGRVKPNVLAICRPTPRPASTGDSAHRCGVADTGMLFAKGAGQRSGIMRLRIRTQTFRPAATIAVAAFCAVAAAWPAHAGDQSRRLPTFTSDV